MCALRVVSVVFKLNVMLDTFPYAQNSIFLLKCPCQYSCLVAFTLTQWLYQRLLIHYCLQMLLFPLYKQGTEALKSNTCLQCKRQLQTHISFTSEPIFFHDATFSWQRWSFPIELNSTLREVKDSINKNFLERPNSLPRAGLVSLVTLSRKTLKMITGVSDQTSYLGSFKNPKYFIFFLIFILYWTIVDLQCCVSFRCIARWFSYTYTDVYSFSNSFPI